MSASFFPEGHRHLAIRPCFFLSGAETPGVSSIVARARRRARVVVLLSSALSSSSSTPIVVVARNLCGATFARGGPGRDRTYDQGIMSPLL